MANVTRHVFEQDGRLFREDINRREIAITPELVASMIQGQPMRVPFLVHHPKWGMTAACVEPNGTLWLSVRLKTLTLRCPYSATKNGIIVPQLDSEDDPMLTRTWNVPSDMRLMFLMNTRHNGRHVLKNEYAYIFAMSQDNNAWRLPIGNLFDDCHLCLGQEEFIGDTHLEVLGKTLEQFELSEWNCDLWKGEKINRTQSLFSFRVNNTGFEQVPPLNHWTQYCYKVSVAITEKIIL